MKLVLLVSVFLCGTFPSLAIPGAPEKITDLEDPNILAAAQFVVLEINKLDRGKGVQVLVGVVKGTSQVTRLLFC